MALIKRAGFWARFTASIVDIFMIVVPLTFVIHQTIGFEEKPLIAWLALVAAYGAIVLWFWTRKGYTPGKKYMRLIVLSEKTNKTIYFPQACWRFICECVSFFSVIGVLLPAFRKDKKTLHDLLSASYVARL
jgi:uncharacterized RDD family membrane protein YckC